MKKIISILCIVLLLCSAMTMAVSAAAGTPEDPVVFNGRDFNIVKIPSGKTYYISFTDTSSAAKCQISVNSSTDKTAGYVVTYGEIVQNSDENGYANITAAPDANGTYLFSITNNATQQATFFISFIEVAPWIISSTPLYEGENTVTTLMTETTLFVFEPEEAATYEIVVDKADAQLTSWNGSVFYVTGVASEAVNGKLEVTCAAVGQTLLIGLSGVSAANITITKLDDYTPPAAIDYQEYQNQHTPQAGFALPDGELIRVDITATHTLVLGDDGIYRYGAANGPVLYVDLTATDYTDLYAICHATGEDIRKTLRGTYLDADGNTCGYEFLTAMTAYADAMDAEGFYYLTEDLANYLQMYGKDQGWYQADLSTFEAIISGNFIEESAWLVNAYYDPTAGGVDPVIPEQPTDPDTPADPDEPDTPADPVDPDTPADPDDPDEPDTPADPDEPDTPADPEEDTPADPEEDTPADPEEDTPADPEEDTPADPEEDTPADPEEDTPADPEEDTPADPEEDTPADPEEDTPADPEEDTPADPEEDTPADPEEDTPADPEEDTPADPEEPDAPADPEKPDAPADPEKPDAPADPEKPDAPTDPEKPDAPADPEKPDAPADPEKPDAPADPEKPDAPADPEKPDAPADPEEPNSPPTGDMSALGAMVALMLSSAGAITVCKKRH